MIILIIAIVCTLLTILFIILAISKDESMFYLGSLAFGLPSVILYIMLLVSFAFDNVNTKKYTALSMAAKHWDELTVYEQINMGLEIRQWNDKLNCYNNYWWKFSIEDRSQYIIEIESNKN